jgi:hypothetical protein
MASPPTLGYRGPQSSYSKAEIEGWGVRDLKKYMHEHAINSAGCIERQDLIELVIKHEEKKKSQPPPQQQSYYASSNSYDQVGWDSRVLLFPFNSFHLYLTLFASRASRHVHLNQE